LIIGYYLDVDFSSLKTDMSVRVASALQRHLQESGLVEMIVCNQHAHQIVSRFCVAYQHVVMVQCVNAECAMRPHEIGVVADTEWLMGFCDRNVFVSRVSYERLLSERNEWIIYNPNTLAVDYCGKPLYR